MERKTQINEQELQIQGLLDRYLASRSPANEPTAFHLDEDSMAAFVEGNLNIRESDIVVSHLVDCGYCRNVTAELVRLDLAFAEIDGPPLAVKSTEPAKISEVLSGLLSRIFGTSDGAVFAHHESEEKKDEDEKKEDTEIKD